MSTNVLNGREDVHFAVLHHLFDAGIGRAINAHSRSAVSVIANENVKRNFD